jgi:hypothetical protein
MARFWSSHLAGVMLLLGTIYAVVNSQKSERPWNIASIAWAMIAGIVGGTFLQWLGR